MMWDNCGMDEGAVDGIVADATSLYEDWRQCQIITI